MVPLHISPRSPTSAIMSIRHNNSILFSNNEIAEAFASAWSNYAKDSNFSLQYNADKIAILSETDNPIIII